MMISCCVISLSGDNNRDSKKTLFEQMFLSSTSYNLITFMSSSSNIYSIIIIHATSCELTGPPTSAQHGTTPYLYLVHHILPIRPRLDLPWRRVHGWEFYWPLLLGGWWWWWRRFWRGGRRLWRTWWCLLLLAAVCLSAGEYGYDDANEIDQCNERSRERRRRRRRKQVVKDFSLVEVPILSSNFEYWFLCERSRWVSWVSTQVQTSWHQTYLPRLANVTP